MEPTDADLAELYNRYAHVLLHRCRSILRNEDRKPRPLDAALAVNFGA